MNQLTSPKIFRSCLLFEFHRGKPIFETYKSFCEVMGYDAITYKEFEIWYYRFSRGEFDLDYEISSEPKTRDFCQLPASVIEKIMDKANYKEQLVMRKVCRDLKSVVDDMRPTLKSIEVMWQLDSTVHKFDDQLVEYSNFKNGPFGDNGIIEVIDKNYKKLALQDLKFPLENPKLRLDRLGIEWGVSRDKMTNIRLFRSVEAMFKSLRCKINVKELTIDTLPPDFEQIKRILTYLQPGYLKVIRMPDFQLKTDELGRKVRNKISEITDLDQWKQAEELCLRYNYDHIPDKGLMNFKKFIFGDIDITQERLTHLRKIFSKSTNFESCIIISSIFHISPDYFESFCEKGKTEKRTVFFYQYKIPDDSDKILEFKGIINKAIIIEKKSITDN